jgi:hypothetical protein
MIGVAVIKYFFVFQIGVLFGGENALEGRRFDLLDLDKRNLNLHLILFLKGVKEMRSEFHVNAYAPALALGVHEPRENVQSRGLLDDLVHVQGARDVAHQRLQQQREHVGKVLDGVHLPNPEKRKK